jgi:hypothetical protein
MRFHIAHARTSENLQLLPELRLTIDYFLVQAKCGLVAAVLLLRGSIARRKIINQAGGCAGPCDLVTAWNTSEPYRILPPAADDPLTVKLFNSN